MIMGPNRSDVTTTSHKAMLMDFSCRTERQELSSPAKLFNLVSSCEWN